MIGVIPKDEFDPFMVNPSYIKEQTAIILFMHYLDKDIKKSSDNVRVTLSCELSFHLGYRPGEVAISAGNFEHTICYKDVVYECYDGTYFKSVEAKNHKVTEVIVCLIHLNSRKADQSGGWGYSFPYPIHLDIGTFVVRYVLLGPSEIRCTGIHVLRASKW